MRSEIQRQPRQIANRLNAEQENMECYKTELSSLLNTNPKFLSESNGYANIIRLARLLRVPSPSQRVLHAYFLPMH